MNKYLIGGGVLVVVVIIAAVVFSGGGAKPASPATPAPTMAAAGRSVPPAAKNNTPSAAKSASPAANTAPAATQNTEDIVPGLYPNPIKNQAAQPGLKVSSILVENNVDAAGKPVNDHLELTLKNLTGQTLSNLEAYYTITDAANGKKEGYYKLLTGFSLPPHGTGTVHFDGKSGAGHYGVNMRGIYGTALDQLKFDVEISAPGYAPVYASATKAPGGAEVVGQ